MARTAMSGRATRRPADRRAPMALYTPRYNREDDPAVLAAFLAAHPFATLVSGGAGGRFATHLPLLFDAGRNVLWGHVARANDHWKHLEASPDALAIFHGAHAYVSSTWYAPPTSIPTWNYETVHVRGRASLVHEPERLRTLAEGLTRAFEPEATLLGPGYDAGQLRAIVGVEIAVTAFEGKFKLSQNRSDEDRRRVIERLRASARADDQVTAEAMARVLGAAVGEAGAGPHVGRP